MSNRGKQSKVAKMLAVGVSDVDGKFQNVSTANLAIYQAAQPNPMQQPATRLGTNPNSSYSSIERVRLSFEGENAFKNTPFARNYVLKRRAYCSSGAKWAPNVGDSAINNLVTEWLDDQFRDMGVNCSMLDAFSRVGDCFLPERGDSALRILRLPSGGFKLIEITADCIGEIYYFQQGTIAYPSIKLADGSVIFPTQSASFQYFAGLYFDGPFVVAYRIYERVGDTVYVNPRNYAASDIIFFKDDLTGGVRGVSIFATALLSIAGRYQILHSTMQTMQQQSKIAAISSNNSGGPSTYSYDAVQSDNGVVTYQEYYADGAVVKYQYNGDSYQVLKAEHPTTAFIEGVKLLDADGCLASGFPYEFLFSASESGGAPSRFAFSIAGREIERIRNEVHRPRLDKIAYLAIANGVASGALPPHPRIYKGNWLFGTLPTADAFRDDISDIKSNRAGLRTKASIIVANMGGNYEDVRRQLKQEALDRHMDAQDANKELVAKSYSPTITVDDIAAISDNPAQQAEAEKTDDKAAEELPGAALKKKDNTARLDDFKEGDHPRNDDGEFGSGGGGSGNKTKAPADSKIDSQSKKPERALVKASANKTPEPKLSEKAQRAKDNHVMVDKHIQRYAEEHNEPKVAKALGGVSFPDGEPIDIAIAGENGAVKHGVELKTVVKNSNGKITMKGEAIARKKSWERKNKATIHTVVVDDSEVFNAKGEGQHDESKRKIYYRRGYGSFRIATMHPVKNFDEVKTLMNTEKRKLPPAAK